MQENQTMAYTRKSAHNWLVSLIPGGSWCTEQAQLGVWGRSQIPILFGWAFEIFFHVFNLILSLTILWIIANDYFWSDMTLSLKESNDST